MKKLTVALILLAALFLPVLPSYTYAQAAPADKNTVNLSINSGDVNGGISPTSNPGKVLGNIISIIFAVAALMVLFMLILGAFNWITSGGEKENVAKARSRITHALIGLLVLALAFFIVKIVGNLVNIDILNLQLHPIDYNASPKP